jgi:poly(A) polymerase
VGFKLPLRVRWKIKKQAPLLTPVSPSRLTEEIIKIIHSSDASHIVEALESLGLYEYLQPNASKLLKENGDFRSRYIKGLADLNQNGETGSPGAALAALIRDYLEDFIDWDAGITENYKNAFLAGRRFVLPMNPPRMQLDQAVRLIFGEHGISIKKSHFFDRGKPRLAEAEDQGQNRGLRDVPEEEPKKKRRRRRPRKGPPPAPAP